MKKVLIIVISILLALGVGLLGYGVSLGSVKPYIPERSGVLAPPPVDIYMQGETPYDVSTYLVKNLTTTQAADAILAVVYNSLMAERYYFNCHVEGRVGKKFSCSDYFRILQRGEDYFYQALTYTGTGANIGVRHSAIGLTRMDSTTFSVVYDVDTKEFDYTFSKHPKVRDSNPGAFSRVPYRIYGLFGLPLCLIGGEGAAVDYSVMTGAAVSVIKPDDSAPFYTLLVKLDPAAVNASQGTINFLNEETNNQMEDINVSSLDFRFEIWESGLFRAIDMETELTATAGGQTGESKITRTYEFSYDAKAASILTHIEQAGWENDVKPADLEMLRAREAGYNKD